MDIPYRSKLRITGALLLSMWLFYSCSPTKYVPKDEYLLSKNRIEAKKKSNDPDEELKNYILQKPNKRFLGVRFYLFLYNLSDINKQKWPHGWLRRISEEPVIFDKELTRSSTEQLLQYLENKGYYNASVIDSVRYKRRNAIVTYFVEYNTPYRIRDISYSFEDTSLRPYILPDTVNSLVHRGIRFDKDILQQERVRIETHLKENSFYRFSKEHIFYEAAVKPLDNAVELTMLVKEFTEGMPDPHSKIRYHPKYKINKVYLYPNFSDAITSGRRITPAYDTLQFRNLYFLITGKSNIKPNALANRNYIIPGSFYKLSDVNSTYRSLSSLSIVRFTNISFTETDTTRFFSRERYLDGKIELTQKKLQTLQAELVGTNSSGDLGGRGNLLYSNFNLFRGAEVFNLRLTGAIESLENQTNGEYPSMREIGAEISIVYPKFFSPFKLERFVKKFAPKTSLSVSYNFQSRPDFTRSVANGSFSYNWRGNKHLIHTVYPLELSYVQIYEGQSDEKFLDSIANTPLGYSFKDHVINSARYTLELNNQSVGKSKDFFFARLNIESAGNLLNVAHSNFGSGDSALLFGVPYFQYLLGDIDLRYYNVIDKQNKFVYRFFVGLGYPIGNSKTLPYEKKYFSGGPNSIRAWSTRDLGPGSDTTSNANSFFPNKNGDIKLEANIEYRFKLVWKLEAALFVDAGNVWEIRKNEEKPLAVFDWSRFYKEIAMGYGFGVRLDLSFFLIRLDVGIKMRDPSLPEGNRWFPGHDHFGMRDLHFKFGIGYPF